MIVIGSTNLSSSLEAVAPVGSVAWLIPPPEADASDQEKRKAASATVPNVQVYCENTRNKDVMGIITQSAPRRKDKSIVEATNLGVCVSGIATTQMDDSGNFVPGARLEVHLPPNQYLDIEQHRNSKWSSLRLKRVSRRKNNGGRLCFRSLGIRKRQQGQVMVALCSMPRGPKDVETELPDQPPETEMPQNPEGDADFIVYQKQLIKYFRGLRSWVINFESDYVDEYYDKMLATGSLERFREWEPKKQIQSSSKRRRQSGDYEPIDTNITAVDVVKQIDTSAAQVLMAETLAHAIPQAKSSDNMIKEPWYQAIIKYVLTLFGSKRVRKQSVDPSNLILFFLAELNDRIDEGNPKKVLPVVLREALAPYWLDQMPPRKPWLHAIPVVDDDEFMTLYLHCSYCVRFLYDWYVSHQDDDDSELYTVNQLEYCINMLLKAILILLNQYDPEFKPEPNTGMDSSSESESEGSGSDSDSQGSGSEPESDEVKSSSLEASDSDSDSAPSLEI